MNLIKIANIYALQNNTNLSVDYLLIDASIAYTKSLSPYVDFLLPSMDTNLYIDKYLPSVITNLPIIVGLCFTDPYRRMPYFCNNLYNKYPNIVGFSNFPSTAIFDGSFGNEINCSHIGFEDEITTFQKSVPTNLFSLAWVHDLYQAESYISRGFQTLALSSHNPVYWNSNLHTYFLEKDAAFLKTHYPDVKLFNVSYKNKLSCKSSTLDGIIYLS